MSVRKVPLKELIAPAPTKRAGSGSYPILSMTMHGGLIDQARKFKKRVASLDTSDYKIVCRNQLVVGFPIDEGVLSFQNLYDEAIVSPAYDIWDTRGPLDTAPSYLERFTRRIAAVERAKVSQRSSLAELDALFASLQHRAFSGQLSL